MARQELPDFLKDPALNEFISESLAATVRGGDDHGTRMQDVLVNRAVDQIRKFFPEQYLTSDATVRPIAGEQPGWAAS